MAKSGMDLNGFKWHGGMLDDSKGWNVASQKEMEEYTATTFIAKARHYLKLTPPDLVQSAEKIWFAAVYAVKQLYLTCGGIDLKSHQTLTRFCDFAIETSGKEEENRRSWVKSWKDAQKMHRDVYGSGHFKRSDYEEVIINVEAFVNALGGRLGGWKQVCAKGKWKKIYKALKAMKPLTGNKIPLSFSVSSLVLKPFTAKSLVGFEKEPHKTAYNRAKDFLESKGKTLPSSWNHKEQILAESTMRKKKNREKEKERDKDKDKDAISDSDSEDSEETDKEFAQARDAFVAHFYKFQEENATPINKR
ncbi:unnamed protein product, partial [Mesorhabditis belari]|uniref:HEPN domain-containing protein n=1 Tax=Mesorhabditis belari TaxID=2138241 RepID=A0AAF3EC51_9BILA